MMVFLISCALMLLLALAFVLLPLLKQREVENTNRQELNLAIHREHLKELEHDREEGLISDEAFNKAVDELELELLSDIGKDDVATEVSLKRSPAVATFISMSLPIMAIGLYFYLGEPGLINPEATPQASQQQNEDMHSILQMVERLEARLDEQPDDGEGWSMLGRSYLVMDRHAEAVRAYQKARELLGDQPALLADTAEAMIMANNNSFNAESVQLLDKVLQADPDNQKALWMGGYYLLEQDEVEQALKLWQHLLSLFPAGSQQSVALQEHIDNVVAQSGIQPPAMPEQQMAQTAQQNTGSEQVQTSAEPTVSIDVHVSLDPGLAEKARPDDVVFVYARAAQGPRMPLAIARKRVSELPLTVTLDDTMAMTPAMSLAKFSEVIVGARISRTGNAMPASGDISGNSGVINLAEVLGVKVTLNEIIP